MGAKRRAYRRVAILFVLVAAAWHMLSERLSAQGGGVGIPAARRSQASSTQDDQPPIP